LDGKPEVITAPLTVLAEQRCRRKAIHLGRLPVAASLSGIPCVKILLRQTMAQENHDATSR
jgi:hypothetical protein